MVCAHVSFMLQHYMCVFHWTRVYTHIYMHTYVSIRNCIRMLAYMQTSVSYSEAVIIR